MLLQSIFYYTRIKLIGKRNLSLNEDILKLVLILIITGNTLNMCFKEHKRIEDKLKLYLKRNTRFIGTGPPRGSTCNKN